METVIRKKGDKWTIDEMILEAKKYPSRSQLRKANPHVYDTLKAKGLIDEVLPTIKRIVIEKPLKKIPTIKRIVAEKPLKKTRAHTYWDNETLINIAKTYDTITTLVKNEPKVYSRIRERKLQQTAFAHMGYYSSLKKRFIYVFEFVESKTAYIGLTCNINQRVKDHLIDGKSPVYKHINKTNESYNFKILTETPIEAHDAAELETITIEKYRSLEWNVLNTLKGGALGNIVLITDDHITQVAKNYLTLKEFKTKEPKLYSLAYGRKLLKEFTFLKSKAQVLIEEMKEAIETVSSFEEFKQKFPTFVDKFLRNKKYRALAPHLTPQKYTPPSIEQITAIVNSADSLTELRKTNRNILWLLKKQGLYTTVCEKLISKEQQKISEAKQARINLIKSYGDRATLRKNNRILYEEVSKRKELDKYFPQAVVEIQPLNHNINIVEGYFNLIDSEIKAYLFGFSLGNACISKKGNIITYRVLYEDNEILDIISKEIAPTVELKILSDEIQKYSTLTFNSDELHKLFSECNITDKTLRQIKYPDIQKKYDKDFIRGVFDACSYTSADYYPRLWLSIGGEIVTTLTNIFSNVISDMSTVNIHPMKNTTAFNIKKTKALAELYEFIYQDSNIFIENKKSSFEKTTFPKIKKSKKNFLKSLEIEKFF